MSEQVRTSEISVVLFLFLTGFILISLFTYDALDIPLYTSSPNFPAVNKVGRVGAYLSGYLLYFPFGLGAWVVPGITLIWGCNEFRRKKRAKLSLKLLGMILAAIASSCAFSLTRIDTSTGRFLPGGIAGAELSRLMLPWLGRWGSYLMIGFLFTLGFLLTSESVVALWAKVVARVSGRAIVSISSIIPRAVCRPTIVSRSRIRRTATVVKRPERREPESTFSAEPRRTILTEPPIQGGKKSGEFQLPPLDLLDPPPPLSKGEENVEEKCRTLEDALRSFGVESHVVQVNQGPIVSSFEVEPARGVKVNQITSLADDIALVLKTSRVRILAPVPGKSVVGIEVPNLNPRFVYLREVLESPEFSRADSKLAVGLGKDIIGKPLIADLEGMPHLLVAGTTGSGKTVCLNSIILSFLFNATPEEVQFLMIDPKRVELAIFENLPHLMAPVVKGAKKASKALRWAVGEMDRRYRVFAEVGVRNIASYNHLEKSSERMPHVVVIIDELHDLMIVAQASVEDAITRLAQLSRAVGIHLVIATQRPSVDVITGVIKANLPYRISFQVSSKVDSRTVLDMNGAETLLGKGDMLFLPPGRGTPVRAQGALVTDKETERVVSFLKKQRDPDYKAKLLDEISSAPSTKEGVRGISEGEIETEMADDDDLFDEAVRFVLQAGKGSTSMLQRRLSIGYSRAARLLDIMEERNIIGPARGTKPRIVLGDKDRNEDEI